MTPTAPRRAQLGRGNDADCPSLRQLRGGVDPRPAGVVNTNTDTTKSA
jgi:hypothetical protein